ncbi:hypothetical protein EDD38_5855 [Kitasatospora cineracea]|uniref:Phosphatidylinositol alpha-1,6-mannosyltransferase n=1 Tax=Kitasatospora cineracea TaxID=88074 RepID=A0A3N4R6B0_9ACTN|nr:hypothetical protein EDD38_5855 [Kitasatospora cineracea]
MIDQCLRSGYRVPERRLWWCAGWVGCAGWAGLFPLVSGLGPHRGWGAVAAVGYLLAAGVALLPRGVARAGGVGLSALTAFGGAVLVPGVLLVGRGSGQSEVTVLARAGDLLLAHGSPYLAASAGPAEVTPYLPGMALFGLPHALFRGGGGPVADPRVWCAVAFLAAGWAAWRALPVRLGTRPVVRSAVRERVLVGAGWGAGPLPGTGAGADVPSGAADAGAGVVALVASPPVALALAASGVDLPLTGLLCLALAFGAAGRPTGAGLALAAAGALKWTAWPAVAVVVALLAATAGRRAALRCAGLAAAGTALLVLPWLLRAPGPMLRQVFAFPLGRGPWPTPAASPLPGRLLADLGPAGWGAAVGLLLLGGAVVGLSLLLRPPRCAVAAADRLAAGLALAFLLAPAGRFGYLALPLFLSAFVRLAARRHPPA